MFIYCKYYVFCRFIFQHLNDPLGVLKIFHPLLEKNGKILFDFKQIYINNGGDWIIR